MLLPLTLTAATLLGGDDRVRLEFRILDEQCKPARVDGNWPNEFEYGERILYCVRCPKGETPSPWGDEPEAADGTLWDPHVAFLVRPGERYLYAYVGKDITPVEGEITIAPGEPLVVRELHVGPTAEQGNLRLRPTRPDGSSIHHDFQVSVESLVTGLTLFRHVSGPSEARYGDRLPAGRYRVRVETEENSPMCGNGWNPKPAPFGDWVSIVEIEPHVLNEVEARMWEGGRLRLALDLPEGMSSRRELWTRRYPWQGDPLEFHWLHMGAHGPGARVTLRPDPAARSPERGPGMPDLDRPLSFFIPKVLACHQAPALLPGDEELSEWIPPGDYLMHVEARDFEPLNARVSIHVGETSALRLQLVAR